MTILRAFVNAMNGVDVIPDAVNWANVSGASPQANANQSITGITSTISISLALSGTSGEAIFLKYRINSGTYVTYSTPFSVSVGDTLNFQVSTIAGGAGAGTVTVTNDSSGSATLDTFTYNMSS